MTEWQAAINDLTTADEFNQLVPEAAKASLTVKMLLHHAATKRGFVFNREHSVYEEKAPVHA
jgi:hypothetical protein